MKCFPRDRKDKFLKNKAHEVEQGSIRVWKEGFGVLVPLVEVTKCRDAIEFEDDYKKEVLMMKTEIQQLANGYK